MENSSLFWFLINHPNHRLYTVNVFSVGSSHSRIKKNLGSSNIIRRITFTWGMIRSLWWELTKMRHHVPPSRSLRSPFFTPRLLLGVLPPRGIFSTHRRHSIDAPRRDIMEPLMNSECAALILKSGRDGESLHPDPSRGSSSREGVWGWWEGKWR